jgi:cytochrome c
MRTIIASIFIITSLVACNKPSTESASEEEVKEPKPNTLTDQEKEAGWKLLFDGKTKNSWKGFNVAEPGTAWKVEDGTLHLDASQKEGNKIVGGGDLITRDEFENYELSIEWKIEPCGNSGIMFNVVEDEKYGQTYLTGPEMQVLDNECHPDAKIIKHRAGDLYDMISVSEETVKPAGEWNQARLLNDHGKVTFWLNGVQTVSFEMHTPEWDAMVAGSKFKDWADFGMATKGHIALQDHENEVWYRNIKIREITP